ncbi:uncharacterized protein LOC122033492 [Zingiber officinale]|uniref:uncharacterized protein LOC122033492 n=1 Tax=Zingiber officinale TaxID=94328 RepID=UPI001C4B0CD9|nr:uncharacterized protein LOC122033492 [Zingiber officinale]
MSKTEGGAENPSAGCKIQEGKDLNAVGGVSVAWRRGGEQQQSHFSKGVKGACKLAFGREFAENMRLSDGLSFHPAFGEPEREIFHFAYVFFFFASSYQFGTSTAIWSVDALSKGLAPVEKAAKPFCCASVCFLFYMLSSGNLKSS